MSKSISVTNGVISHAEFARLVNDPKISGASRTFRGKKPILGPGVMVSDKGNQEITKPPLTEKQAETYYDKHLLESDDSSAHGGWKEQNSIYQDTSKKYVDLDQARVVGKKNNQISGYVLENTDKEMPHGGFMYFDRDLPGVQADKEWKDEPNKTSRAERLAPKPKRGERKELAGVNRSSRKMNKKGKSVPVTINEVLGTIASNRRKKRAVKL